MYQISSKLPKKTVWSYFGHSLLSQYCSVNSNCCIWSQLCIWNKTIHGFSLKQMCFLNYVLKHLYGLLLCRLPVDCLQSPSYQVTANCRRRCRVIDRVRGRLTSMFLWPRWCYVCGNQLQDWRSLYRLWVSVRNAFYAYHPVSHFPMSGSTTW